MKRYVQYCWLQSYNYSFDEDSKIHAYVMDEWGLVRNEMECLERLNSNSFVIFIIFCQRFVYEMLQVLIAFVTMLNIHWTLYSYSTHLLTIPTNRCFWLILVHWKWVINFMISIINVFYGSFPLHFLLNSQDNLIDL